MPAARNGSSSPSGTPLHAPAPPAWGRSSYVTLGCITLLAIFLRVWHVSRLGLSHFDEGVYTLSGFWSLPSFPSASLYPWQKLFAPPVYFTLVGLAYRLAGGPSDLVAIAINIVAGVATVALVAWIAHRWLGPAAAIFAATLVATQEFQIALSRTALTDTLFSFLFLLSLAGITIALEKDKFSLALLAGVGVGVAWNTKYHGWLALAITLAMLVFPVVWKRSLAVLPRRQLALWLVACVVAAACFLPWLYYTETRLGGYRAVEEFHSQFFNFRWIANLLHQAAIQLYYDGWLSRIGPALAFWLAAAAGRSQAKRRWRLLLLAGIGLLVAGIVASGIVVCLALAIVGCVTACRRGRVFGRLLVATFIVFFVLTPCYVAYARLLLPWVLATQLLAGAAVQAWIEDADLAVRLESKLAARVLVPAGGIAVLVVAAIVVWGLRSPGPRTWAPSDDVRDATTRLGRDIPRGSTVIVDQEPDAAFYFQRAGYTTICIHRLAPFVTTRKLHQSLERAGAEPAFLVAGAGARSHPDWTSMIYGSHRFQRIANAGMQPSELRLLDDMSPRQALEYRLQPDSRYQLELFLITPAPEAATSDPSAGNPATVTGSESGPHR